MASILHNSCKSASDELHESFMAPGKRYRLAFFPMNFKKEIGRRLREERTSKEWSLEKLSEQTDGKLSVSRISNYEQGTRMPKPSDILILSQALESDPAYLMCLEDRKMSPEERQLLKDLAVLPEKDRMDYIRRIKALALVYRDPVPDEDPRLTGWSANGKPLDPAAKPQNDEPH